MWWECICNVELVCTCADLLSGTWSRNGFIPLVYNPFTPNLLLYCKTYTKTDMQFAQISYQIEQLKYWTVHYLYQSGKALNLTTAFSAVNKQEDSKNWTWMLVIYCGKPWHRSSQKKNSTFMAIIILWQWDIMCLVLGAEDHNSGSLAGGQPQHYCVKNHIVVVKLSGSASTGQEDEGHFFTWITSFMCHR